MTKLWIASDMHFGESISSRPAPTHDVFIVAGDFSRLDKAISTLQSGIIGNGLTVFVPGNHEFYGSVIEDAERAGADAAGGTKVFLLNPGVITIGGIRFVGATLWTDYMLFGLEGFAQAMAEASVETQRPQGDPDARRLPAGPFAPVHAGGCLAQAPARAGVAGNAPL